MLSFIKGALALSLLAFALPQGASASPKFVKLTSANLVAFSEGEFLPGCLEGGGQWDDDAKRFEYKWYKDRQVILSVKDVGDISYVIRYSSTLGCEDAEKAVVTYFASSFGPYLFAVQTAEVTAESNDRGRVICTKPEVVVGLEGQKVVSWKEIATPVKCP